MRTLKLAFFIVCLYIRNILVAIDQLFNALLGGDPNEVLSSRIGKHRENCRICDWICRLLDKIDKRHCSKTIEKDEGSYDLFVLIKKQLKGEQ